MTQGTDAAVCGHITTTDGGRNFVCISTPHPDKPDHHQNRRVAGEAVDETELYEELAADRPERQSW